MCKKIIYETTEKRLVALFPAHKERTQNGVIVLFITELTRIA